MSTAETWTRLEDIPKPVAPGSYRFGWRQRNARTIPTTRQTLGILRGVRTPLLSEITANSEVRYGLDVIEGREASPQRTRSKLRGAYTQAANKNQNQNKAVEKPATSHSDFMRVKLKTRETNERISFFLLNEERTKSYVDFARLHPYKWANSDQYVKLPPVSAGGGRMEPSMKGDLKTFDLDPNGYGLRHKKVTPKEGPLMRKSAPADCKVHPKDVDHFPPPRTRYDDLFELRLSIDESGDPVNMSRSSKTRKSSRPYPSRENTSASILNNTGAEDNFNVTSLKQEGEGDGPPLYTRVKQSIHFMKKFEKGESAHPTTRLRPLQAENVKYRPHSQTIVVAAPPDPRLAATLSPEKNPKSAEVYVKMLRAQELEQLRSRDRLNSHNTLQTTDIEAMLAHYTDLQPAEMTQRTQSTIVMPDTNRNPYTPVSQPSQGAEDQSRGNAEEIPTWAKREGVLDEDVVDDQREGRPTGSPNSRQMGSTNPRPTGSATEVGRSSTRNSVRVDLPKSEDDAPGQGSIQDEEELQDPHVTGPTPMTLRTDEELRLEAKTVESSVSHA